MCGCRILVHDPWGPGGEPLVLCNLEAKGRPSPPGHLQVVAPRSPLSKEWVLPLVPCVVLGRQVPTAPASPRGCDILLH